MHIFGRNIFLNQGKNKITIILITTILDHHYILAYAIAWFYQHKWYTLLLLPSGTILGILYYFQFSFQ